MAGFSSRFNSYYGKAMATDFNQLSLQEQVSYVKLLYDVRMCITLYVNFELY